MFRTSHTTTIRDLRAALRMSRMVTPPKPLLLELIDDAIRECRDARRELPMDRWNDYGEALSKLREARTLIEGGRS